MFIQIGTLVTEYLSINQESFISIARRDGHDDDFVRVIKGDSSRPEEIETENIYTQEQTMLEDVPIVCETRSTLAQYFRENNYEESPAYWSNESVFAKVSETVHG